MALLFAIEEDYRRILRRNRIFRDRVNPLDNYDDTDLIKRYRMPRHVILQVVDLLVDDIEHPTQRSHAIPATLQVLCALRYYATGNFQFVSGDLNGISQASVSRIISRVSNSLAGKSREIIKFPRQEDQQAVKEGFYERNRHRIPNVIGCIDGSLVQIKAPNLHEDAYVCRKNYHAINIQGICNHHLKFTNIVANWPGSCHDAFIWNNCRLRQEFEDGNQRGGYLLGDSAYPLRPWRITPIHRPQNEAENVFNEHHRRERQNIENTFGRWKMRWLCIHKFGGAMTLQPTRCVRVIVATAVLHNICEENGVPIPGDAPPNLDDNPDDDVNPQHAVDNREDGIYIRNQIIQGSFA